MGRAHGCARVTPQGWVYAISKQAFVCALRFEATDAIDAIDP